MNYKVKSLLFLVLGIAMIAGGIRAYLYVKPYVKVDIETQQPEFHNGSFAVIVGAVFITTSFLIYYDKENRNKNRTNKK
jgi:hypothetical protein